MTWREQEEERVAREAEEQSRNARELELHVSVFMLLGTHDSVCVAARG